MRAKDHTVGDLIALLQHQDSAAEIFVTYEGLDEPFDIYQAADGRVVLDADSNTYKVDWQESKCDVCGKAANGTPFFDRPVCYSHWKAYREGG